MPTVYTLEPLARVLEATEGSGVSLPEVPRLVRHNPGPQAELGTLALGALPLPHPAQSPQLSEAVSATSHIFQALDLIPFPPA